MSSARPNIRSVAEVAGVSHQTVSRVLNGHPSIRPQTRERVLDAIESLGYRRSGAAVALATRRTRRIGVLVDSAFEYGPNATLSAVQRAARDAGYSVAATNVDDRHAIDAHDSLDHLVDQGIDALCIVAPRASSVDLAREAATALPTLVVKPEPDEHVITISVDQRLGARLAVQHLLDLGHHEVLHVAGPPDWLDARERELGWRETLEAGGAAARHIVVASDWTSDAGFDIARSFGADPPFTAVFAANDRLALGLVHGFASAGIRVPERVSVVGFDDVPDARHFLPPLTTVRQPFDLLGSSVVAALISAVDGVRPEAQTIPPALVERATTGRPWRE